VSLDHSPLAQEFPGYLSTVVNSVIWG
jgi:hypothetical protein